MQLYFEGRTANSSTATSVPGVLLVRTDHDHEIAASESETTSSILTRILIAGSLPQKGIVHYGLAQNRQNPLAGTLNAAIFNTFRRTRGQILYWGVPLLIAYEAMQWAIEK